MQLIVNFTKNIRIFFFGIDWLLYNFIPTIYNFIITISRTSILSQGQIKDIGGRIQALLGVFMLFKVAMSIITYIINPDEFSDKSKGFAKLWQNAIISLILLILTPYIFGMAYDLQGMLLEDNSLMNLVFGDKSVDSNFRSNAGQEIAFSVMIPFFLPHTANGDNINHDISSCNNVLNADNTFNNECMEAMLDETRDQRNDESDAITIENYTKGIELRNLGLTFRSDAALMTTNWNDSFVINYKFLISTAVAVVVLLILITFCMDVALRSVKLAFLQLIAPIPIISYIDPKQGKDGMFKKWYQMCFSTYLSLFVRLLALYLGVYMIGIVVRTGATDIVTGESVDNFLVQLVMIIGILMFVKQLPKILEGLGIKLDGGGKFQLNPFKKFEEEAFGGKQILGAGATAGAAMLAGASNFGSRLFNRNTWRNADGSLSFGSVLRGVGRTAGSTIAGQASSIFRGTGKIMKGEKAGKIFADSYGEAMFAKIQREDLNRKGSTWWGRRKSDIHRWTGTLDAAQQQTLDYGAIETQYKADQESIKAKQEALTRQKESEKKDLSDKSKALTRINDLISSEKSVKDIDDQIKSLTDSGGYFAHAGELNANGRDAHAKMVTETKKLRLEEQNIKNRIEENRKKIEEMRKNGTYNSVITGSVSSAASKLEDQIKSDSETLAAKINYNDNVIEQWENAIKNNDNLHYKVGDLTEEGQLLKDKLDAEKAVVYDKLKLDPNSEIKTQVEILHQLGVNNSEFEQKITVKDKDGKDKVIYSFNKGSMYDAQKAVQAVDAKYQVEESQYAEELRQLTDKFEADLKEYGLDKSSAQWKSNEADHAAAPTKGRQPDNFMPSPDTAGASRAYDPRYIGGFNGNRNGGTPPPPPPRGNP